MADSELEGLLPEQIAYFRTRAAEYDATSPLGTHADVATVLSEVVTSAPLYGTLDLAGRRPGAACSTRTWPARCCCPATGPD